MLARDFSRAMLGKFVQCWRGICSNLLLSKNEPVQNKNHLKVMLFRRQCTGFFLCNIVWSLLGNVAPGFSPVQFCPKSTTTTLNRIFSCTILSGATWTTLHKIFFLYNVYPRVLRQHCAGFFSVQCCLESLGQHCTMFLPVQCCPKCIETTLNRTFSCALLSGASRTTLHWVFTCAMLS